MHPAGVRPEEAVKLPVLGERDETKCDVCGCPENKHRVVINTATGDKWTECDGRPNCDCLGNATDFLEEIIRDVEARKKKKNRKTKDPFGRKL